LQTHGDSEWATADVSALATNADMKIALGLMQDNIHIDQQTYDSNNNLTGARVRIYSNNESVGTDDDVLATWAMTAVFSGSGTVTDYQMARQT